MINAIVLKKCPNCGGDKVFRYEYRDAHYPDSKHIRCMSCCTMTAPFTEWEQAQYHWNNRPIEAQQRERVVELKNILRPIIAEIETNVPNLIPYFDLRLIERAKAALAENPITLEPAPIIS